MTNFIQTLPYILIGLIALMFMITIHEFGHYVVGKALGFKIVEFSIGFGPKIFQKKREDGQLFSIRLIPLGGYCQFDGEDGNKDSKGAFNNMHPFRRILVLISGALFNFVSAILIVIIAFSSYGDNLPFVYEIPEDSLQYESNEGLKLNDIIYEVNGKKIFFTNDIENQVLKMKDGDPLEVVVIRNGEKIALNVPYSFQYAESVDLAGNPVIIYKPIMGFTMAYKQVKFSFGESIIRSAPYCIRAGGIILKSFGQLITGKLGLDAIGGPVSTITMTVEAARSGFSTMLFFITVVSVNLAVFNLLPIPALDGSKVIFCLIEWIRHKPNNRKIENIISVFGFIFIILFAVFIDLIKLF